MELLRFQQASLAFGTNPVLDQVDFSLFSGERVCLVGRNGAGKSTFLKLLTGQQNLDDGQIVMTNGVILSRLEQDPPAKMDVKIADFIREGAGDLADKVQQFYTLSENLDGAGDAEYRLFESLQADLDARDGWGLEARVEMLCQQFEMDGNNSLATLSGGWLRKAALARALIAKPDILLLDEPTNHLDVAAINWLEQFLLSFGGAIIFISHDRAFIRALATRIIDLDRGQLTSHPGNYQEYLDRKQKMLEDEQQHNSLFDKRLAEEEVWIRQGIKARRTRNEGRVRALKALRQERAARVEQLGKVDFNIEQAARSGKLVFETKALSHAFSGKAVLNDLDLLVMRGDRIALLGPNGVGKSTLIKLLLGDYQQDSGEIKRGTNLEVAYFDQHRMALDLNATVQDNVADGKQEITQNGQTRHVLSYLQDFLFPPLRARTPVRALSGGEKNRLLLAKLFARPSNLLILDEPTNDLDVETLELLEDILQQYQGTVLLVSHDREFVNNTVTSSLLFAGEGKIIELAGGYDEVIAWQKRQQTAQNSKAPVKNNDKNNSQVEEKPIQASVNNGKKLSYKEKRELELLPVLIEELDQQVKALQLEVNDAEFFKGSAEHTQQRLNLLQDTESKLAQAYTRWEELEAAIS
ncbi:ATP-binding cassette domain-containing protein [Alishewanella sp. SMS8]|uniref:ATP-binding cassette ATPase Uup n=1 Tax=Alishewanella sp. SMS8 TaxID=2994676 RepID=UPI002741E475|nr:ATP-binding cassette domain-containing protein [Alishewanella sp. SMS8]MDP4944224.1 ATP-binding cassette domain-containing protein [Alishewanella sp.]MDP5035061.1 ATP-binding cassette domain-containing protein [Alishewanella sp.]MDP5185594.1 ATP-binding cassette domain-containing protein [Alishewanella sp.]MDP5460375.1 ATP-binding cassette domain-containing protein [Alishewanella sp. SMS8]